MDTSNEEREQNFEKLKSFFKSDISVKNALMDLAPTELDDYDEQSRIEYMDRLYRELGSMEFEFLNMCQNFCGNIDIVKEKFSQIREELTNFSYSSGDIRTVYQQNFSSMREEIVEEVKEKCVGYTLNDSISDLVQDSKTINELLHVFHSYIVNNEEIMHSMPILGEKVNDFGYPIMLYGEPTELSKKIFDKFPKNLDVGYTDIVAMNNKVLMMVRDRGHALTIEINENKDGDIVSYFVPKICNMQMVKQLPGINKISQSGAKGIFGTSKEETIQKLFDFIGKVPTDQDMAFNVQSVNKKVIDVQDTKEEIFNAKDAKDMAMETGENGRRITGIKKILQKLKEGIRNIQNKAKEVFSKDEGKDDLDR